MNQKIIIVGAGLTGSLLAIYMARYGYTIEVYERRPDMRKVSISAGKSINLAISARGIHALEQIGLAQEVLKRAVPMRGRQIHVVNGDQHFQPYGKNENEYINSISRKELNILLMNEAEKFPNIQFYFDQRCTGMNIETGDAYFTDEHTAEKTAIKGDTVIGTDGSASAIRMEFLKSGFFNFSQAYEDYGYKELNIPAANNGGFRLEKNALHIWPRGSYMMIALPNIDGDFTCTLFMAHTKGNMNLDKLHSKEEVQQFFKEVMPDAYAQMPTLLDDFFSHPTGNLLTIKCEPWNIDGKVLLMGDAAHAIVPFFGQGMNCGFEDCYYFDSLIKKHGNDWKKVFTEFTAIRKENTDAIADLALENFVEMRDLVAHKDFILKKKADVLLEEQFPDRFISKYSMVSFHRVPYAIAMKRGQIQDKVLMQMCSKIDKIEQLDLEEAMAAIGKEMEDAGLQKKLILSE